MVRVVRVVKVIQVVRMDMVVKGQGGKGGKGHSEAAMLSSQLLDLGPIKMRHWYGGAHLGKTHES